MNGEEDLVLYCLKAFRKVVNEEELSGERLVEMQHKLDRLGMTVLVIKLISGVRSDQIVHEAIRLGISLLHGGNPRVQETIYEYFRVRIKILLVQKYHTTYVNPFIKNHTESEEFFLEMRNLLRKGIAEIEEKREQVRLDTVFV